MIVPPFLHTATNPKISIVLSQTENKNMKPFLLSMLFSMFLHTMHAQVKTPHRPLDDKATQETINLYRNLHAWQGKSVLFGHQDALAYGVNWKYEPGRSDVRDVSGAHPALFGWELGHLELDSARSLDEVPFDKIRSFITTAYAQGGVNTISWHLKSPLNGKTAWDVTPGTVKSILPGGGAHAVFLTYLDRLAVFLRSLKTPQGKHIPILFRPFHEMTGSWFWWGQDLCTADEFTQLWRFTVDYLKQKHKLHHLIYVYNTAEFTSREHFLARYPGDDYVDVLSFDTYQYADSKEYMEQVASRLAILQTLAAEKGKLFAFAETGHENIPQPDWWTTVLLPPLRQYKPSYVMVWRNAGLMKDTGKMHYYAPYSGHPSAADFVRFVNDPVIVSGHKTRAMNLYTAGDKKPTGGRP